MVGGAQAITDETPMCASSCTLAFLCGVRRVAVKSARFVVHNDSTSKEHGSYVKDSRTTVAGTCNRRSYTRTS